MRQRSQSRGQELLAEALVALDARVVPADAPPAQPGDAPAAAQFGATGTFSTEAAKLNAALPKLKAAADAYPDAPAGITARYHMAGALAALGRHDEAITAFDDVDAGAPAPNTLYGRMARLGKADAQARAGQLDAAIATWKTMVTQDSRRAAGGRDPDRAGARLRDQGQHRRGEADLHADRRPAPRLALRGGSARRRSKRSARRS